MYHAAEQPRQEGKHPSQDRLFFFVPSQRKSTPFVTANPSESFLCQPGYVPKLHRRLACLLPRNAEGKGNRLLSLHRKFLQKFRDP